jgi:hypothetical protein
VILSYLFYINLEINKSFEQNFYLFFKLFFFILIVLIIYLILVYYFLNSPSKNVVLCYRCGDVSCTGCTYFYSDIYYTPPGGLDIFSIKDLDFSNSFSKANEVTSYKKKVSWSLDISFSFRQVNEYVYLFFVMDLSIEF